MPKFPVNAFLNKAFPQNDNSFESTIHDHTDTVDETLATPAHFQSDGLSNITINRPALNHNNYRIYAQYNKPTIPLKTRIRNTLRDKLKCNGSCLLDKFLSFLPFIGIFKGYKLTDFFNDLVAGLTVGIINIPQGVPTVLTTLLQ